MNDKMQYPSTYELEHVLSEFCSSKFVDEFAQEKGVILIRDTKEKIAEGLSKYYFDRADVVKIRNAAYRKTTKHAIAGFILNIPDSLFSPVTAIQQIRAYYGNNDTVKFDPIIKVEGEDELYNGRVSYKRFKPGRVELLQGEEVNFEYSLQKVSTDNYQVFIDGSKSTDSKKFEDILKKQIGKLGNIELMNFDKFTTKQAITFFDELARRFDPEVWLFKQVRHLIIKRVKDRDEEEKEVEGEDLSGITQAILEGSNLRENAFVRQSEKEGYTFTAMAYEFHHASKPYVIRIKADFKSRPKVFEVSVISYMRREGYPEVLIDIAIDKKLEYEINTSFWKVAKQIYDGLTYGSRTLVKAE